VIKLFEGENKESTEQKPGEEKKEGADQGKQEGKPA